MGLLDDAIREHLELKRLRGADPGEVAREQREALDPVPRHPEEETHEGQRTPDDTPAPGDQLPQPVHPARDADFSNVGQETAELDMRAVLDEASGTPGLHVESDPEGVVAGSLGDGSTVEATEPSGEESLEWEMPASSSHEGSGREENAGAPVAGVGSHEADEAAEDVLEETPDFLRDTPEQERMWFEQRPPRDFDFDK
ncbi:MAG TPA: hypothetical protein VGG98_09460 [Solirubrobacteraceae bacterium]